MYVFYLPYFHLLMLPFAFLPFLLASGLWSALKVFALWRLWKLLAPKSENPWFGILPFLILFTLILSDFRLGQVNLLILWMLVEASLFQSGKGVLAGSFLCLAAVKIIPLIFLWDWLMERKWKALGFFFIFSAIFWLVTSLWVSLTPLEQIRQFMQMTQVKLSSSEASFFQNQSFLGVGQRLFPGRTGTLLAVAFSMASLLIACLVSFRWAPMNMEERLAIWIPLMLLCSPDSRPTHMVMLLAPLFIVLKDFLKKKNQKFTGCSFWLLAFTVIVMILTGKDLVGSRIYEAILGSSLGALLILSYFFYGLSRPHRRH